MRNPVLLLCLCMAASCRSNTNTAPVTQKILPFKLLVKTIPAGTNDLEAVQPLLASAPQLFSVSARTIRKIQGKGGTRITVDPSKLETADGKPVTGAIQVTLKEMTNAYDMIRENAPTISDGRLLESDGSYYIAMTSDGQALHIKNGKGLIMEFTRHSNKKMELFSGERNTDGSINWKQMHKELTPVAVPQAASVPKISRTVVNNNNGWYTARRNLINATKSYHASMLWLRAYEDSVMAARRDWIANSCAKLTLQQVASIMESPLRISRREIARLRIPFTLVSNKKGEEMHIASSVTYHLTPLWVADSMELTKEINSYQSDPTIKWIKPDSNNTADKIYAQEHPNMSTQSNFYVNPGSDDPGIAGIDDSVTTDPTTKTKSLTISYYQPVEISGLGYINCDHFYQAPYGTIPLYTLNIQGQAPKVVGVYVIFRDINSMLSDKVYADSTGKFTINEKLPLNANVELLVYTKIGNQIVESKQAVKVTNNMGVSVAFKPVADGQVQKLFLEKS